MIWRVLGIFLSAQSDAGALTFLYRHWFTWIDGFFSAILMSFNKKLYEINPMFGPLITPTDVYFTNHSTFKMYSIH